MWIEIQNNGNYYYQQLVCLFLVFIGSLLVLQSFCSLIWDLGLNISVSEFKCSEFLHLIVGVTDTDESDDTVTFKWISTLHLTSFDLKMDQLINLKSQIFSKWTICCTVEITE